MKKNITPPQQLHLPVLLEATINLLQPKAGESYLDLTAGYGGHAQEVLKISGVPSKVVLVDRDQNAISELKFLEEQGAALLHMNFFEAAKELVSQGTKFDMILMDLGVSSPQLDRAERGFSFAKSGPLDMRMDDREAKTAAELVNSASEEELSAIIRNYGEEPQAKKIARVIVENRPFTATDKLAEVIAKTSRWKRSRTHPATRTFQAIRIALNREIELLKETLPLLPDLLNPGGRVAIISFHSIEDRIVKHFFKGLTESGYESEFSTLTKKPISGATEDVYNPRSRSAKLRGVVKIKKYTERS